MSLAKRVERVSSSVTLEITSLAKRMKQDGRAVINFAAGEPDFDTPEYIKKAAVAAIKEGFTKYTPATGLPELKQAIAEKLKKDNCLHYSPSQIIVTCGAKHALYNILQALCQKGDQVLFASPYWVSYPEMVTLAEGRAGIIRTNSSNNFKLDKQSLQRNITKKTKVLILNSPANPTGSVYSRDELKELTEVALGKGLYIISDEIYEKLIFDGKNHTSCASLNKQTYTRTIVVNGVSKSYAMTGWRIGYLAACDERIIKAIGNLQSHSTSNPCSISQMAALEALKNKAEGQMQRMVKQFQHRRDAMLRGLDQIRQLSYVRPEGGFYVFCNISKSGLDSISFSRRLLKEKEVATVPGKAFGRDDYIRFSFATSADRIEEGLNRIKDWVGKWVPR